MLLNTITLMMPTQCSTIIYLVPNLGEDKQIGTLLYYFIIHNLYMFIFFDKTNLADSFVISNLLCAVSFLMFLCLYIF